MNQTVLEIVQVKSIKNMIQKKFSQQIIKIQKIISKIIQNIIYKTD